MKFMYMENEMFKIETYEDGNTHMRIVVFLDDNATMTLQVPNSDYEKMIEDGIIDIMDDDDFEDDYCECPCCKIEEQIETLKLYLDEALSECDFEEIKNITESIKNLMEIREML